MKFSALLRGYRLLETNDLIVKKVDFNKLKTELIYNGLYNGFLDSRINAIEIIIRSREKEVINISSTNKLESNTIC